MKDPIYARNEPTWFVREALSRQNRFATNGAMRPKQFTGPDRPVPFFVAFAPSKLHHLDVALTSSAQSTQANLISKLAVCACDDEAAHDRFIRCVSNVTVSILLCIRLISTFVHQAQTCLQVFYDQEALLPEQQTRTYQTTYEPVCRKQRCCFFPDLVSGTGRTFPDPKLCLGHRKLFSKLLLECSFRFLLHPRSKDTIL